ncbi:MAG: class I tRNA ligase family protein [Actinobacteria bacterium]|nr:class I tRNA ligase family protein [Actinomycetota bacterium]MBW3649252.1 class I tRNA ligase family protein [Actinomycetota bacterium]
MPGPQRTVTAPLRVCRGLGYDQLAMVVAADAVVRRSWSQGRPAELLIPAVGADGAARYQFERELSREGHDRVTLGPDAYEQRAAAFVDQRMAAVSEVLAGLGVACSLTEVSTASPEVVRASRTAFVTLYEQGLIEHSQRVVLGCPRCRTPLDRLDVEEAQLEGERLTLSVTTSDGHELLVETDAPELLPGAVAVLVPAGHPAAGGEAVVPVAARQVPVLESPEDTAVRFVVAAHDVDAHELVLHAGLPMVPVFDGSGVVGAPGPLHGLGRYAARAAARQLLVAEGVVVAAQPGLEQVQRCGCCGSVVVPHLGWHWFLRSGEMDVGAGDAVRDGLISFVPSDAREEFLAVAAVRRDWCLSSAVAGGVAVPAARCLDCGRLAVETEPTLSCGGCMGPLTAEQETLDSRFVAAVWALVLGGWPQRRAAGNDGHEAAAVVAGQDLAGWVLPAVALGLRLAGTSPFCRVMVHPWPTPVDLHAGSFVDDTIDRRVRRLALVEGTGDLTTAHLAVEALDQPEAACGDDPEAAADAAAALAALGEEAPRHAAGRLAAALRAGVPAEAAERLRAMALPILGE